ncbi:MAG: Wzz/FepE/Etk N-terminal domain-containing protein [Gemmatimonadota bacterium]|nr:Wzz/FepE/Etk N-terminal domain-containing protein [Gemmatimonadota bacterium]
MHIAQPDTASDHLTLTRWLAGVLLRWRLVAGITVGVLLIGLLATFIVPPVYRSHASFVANSSSSAKLQGAGSSTTGLGGLISQLGGSVGGDPSESPNFYVELLASRELLTRVIQSKFPNPRTSNPRDSATLLSILQIKRADPQRQLEIAVKKIREGTHAGLDPKTNLVWFSVDEQWPDLSAEIANRMIELVSSFNRETRVSRSKSKRAFLQMRHDSAQAALRGAEERQRVFYEQNRGFISAPSLKYEEQRIRREVDLASDLYINLDRQLEVARIDEINDAALITVIDSAVVPRKAQWPRYGVLLFSATAIGLLIGIVVAASASVIGDWRARNPESWSEFRAALKTTGAELGSMVGLGSKNRVPSLAPTETYPTVHPVAPQSTQPGRADEPAAMARHPVA